jgi:L-ascorbate metabolism protein UlaG (beta-lactamase superfamily)
MNAITWIGHGTVLIELDGARLITDPVLRNRVGPLTRIVAGPAASASEGVDAILLSHLHADHADAASLRQVGRETPVIAPTGAGRWVAAAGMRSVRELGVGETTEVGPLSVSATPAHHDGRRWPIGGSGNAEGFVVRGAERSVYFAGDTDLFPQMEELGPLDVALIPIWGWGPALGPGHLDPERAAQAAARLQAKIVIPIHWGTFAVGRPARRPADPRKPLREFLEHLASEAPAAEPRVLEPGQRTEV